MASSKQGKKPMEREGESLDQESGILGRKGQDKRKERGLGASVVGGSSTELSRDKSQARGGDRVQQARTEAARSSS